MYVPFRDYCRIIAQDETKILYADRFAKVCKNFRITIDTAKPEVQHQPEAEYAQCALPATKVNWTKQKSKQF